MATKKARLGRGLDALIAGGNASGGSRGTATQTANTKKQSAPQSPKQSPPETGPILNGFLEVPLGRLQASRFQPRREFPEDGLRELAESIRAEGLLQPIVVRRSESGFEIVAGERRWRACQLLRLKKVPVRLIQAEDSSAAIMALIENLQREDLNPIDEAMGYAMLLRDFNLTQEAVAERVGKSRPAVANALRLLQLDREAQGFLAKGLLSVGHAKVLLGVEDSALRSLLVRRVVEQGLSVRATEQLASAQRKQSPNTPPRADRTSASKQIQDLEKRVSARLNTKVTVRHSPKRGRIVIEYYGNEDLQRILETLGIRL